MYPGKYAIEHPDQSCFIMASSGEAFSYSEFESRSNRLAHLFRDQGLQRLDHYSIYMENNSRYLEMCGAGERSGLYYTCINSHLVADELAYIVNNSDSKVVLTSVEKLDVVRAVVPQCPAIERWLVVDGPPDEAPFEDYLTAVSGYPDTPITDERRGSSMLYSSGTTGRPKGILRPLADAAPDEAPALTEFLHVQWRYREGQVYLSPAPLYHSAPQGAVGLTIRSGGTAIIMERFDPEQFLQLVERYRVTHSQLVPTMFNRMLKLPAEVRSRYDLSSLETVVHAAAPCPIPVKEAMIEWWGPKIIEYYAATEGIGYTTCDSYEWLAHKGTVGQCKLGVLHILDDDYHEVPNGTPGTIWFESPGRSQLLEGPAEDQRCHDA